MTTEVIEAIVDQITYTNSAFATSVKTGEVIFINSRIVSAVGLSMGDTKNFFVTPKLPRQTRASCVESDAC
jgi:hypothetical protein